MPEYFPVATRQFSDYIPWPDLTETAVQDAIPTESYGNFGLAVGPDYDDLIDPVTGDLELY
jgi:peptidyl-tRNA hydrolase